MKKVMGHLKFNPAYRAVFIALIFILLIFSIGGYREAHAAPASVPGWTDCATQAALPYGIPQAQCDALLDLYTSTNGASWTDNTNWLADDDICSTWYGITCAGGNVTGISLGSNNLVGGLPSSLSDLTALTVLEEDNNLLLTGQIPTSIWSPPTALSLTTFLYDTTDLCV